MHSSAIAALLLATSASLTHSMPASGLYELTNITENGHLEARGGAGTHCSYPREYELSMAPFMVYENPVLISGLVVGPDPYRARLDAGYTYTVSFSLSGGASGSAGFKLAQVASKAVTAIVGISLSFGVSWTKGTQVSSQLFCPANVICGLTAAAQYLHAEGLETIRICGWDGESDPSVYPCQLRPDPQCNIANANVPFPFSSDFPVKFDNSLVDGQDNIVTNFNACAYGYPDGGLPQCPSSVELPPGMTCNIQQCTALTCNAMCAKLVLAQPSPICQWSPSLGCSWCDCRPYTI